MARSVILFLLLLTATACTYPAQPVTIILQPNAISVIIEQPVSTPTHEPTPTQESAYTPAPTWTPAPDVFVVYEVTGILNVRSGPGVQYETVMQLQPGDLVEADPRISIEANGYTWFQVWDHSTGELLGWSANHRLAKFHG